MQALEDNSSYGMPDCRICGDNRQVWRNQISGKLKCHRAYCETEVPMEDILEAFVAMQKKLAAIEAGNGQRVPDGELLTRHERSWHRMGELWERCQGKGWPQAESAEFTRLRDEVTPATRAALLASTPAPAQRETTHDELDFHSDAAINGQQRGLACTLAMGQQVGCSRRQGRSDPETEKAFRLAVTAVAKPIAIAVAKNCNSVPQLTFPHIYLGLADLFSEHQEQPQQERAVIGYVPMSAVEETPLDGYVPVYAPDQQQEAEKLDLFRRGYELGLRQVDRPPQQERGPMTDDGWRTVFREAANAFFSHGCKNLDEQVNACAHAAMRATERHHGIRKD